MRLHALIPTSSFIISYYMQSRISADSLVMNYRIDSLCIVQDCLKDWQKEAATMCDVYSQAFCNIAATGAKDGSDGLFFERDPLVHCPFTVQVDLTFSELQRPSSGSCVGVYHIISADAMVNQVEEGPLNQRAWVYQERLLSTRVIHFSDTQVFWECMENTSAEVFPDSIPSFARDCWVDPRGLSRLLFHGPVDSTTKNSLYKAWRGLVATYSTSRLSHEEDRIVAISGIGQLVSEVIKDDLVCGLWRGRLIQELCWVRILDTKVKHTASRPEGWLAPTWSWASTNAQAWPSNMRHHTFPDCKTFQMRASVEDIDVKNRAFGQLESAKLKLCGRVLTATFTQNSSTGLTRISCADSSISCFRRSLVAFRIDLDERGLDFEKPTELVCLTMYSCGCDESIIGALALQRCASEPLQYVRIGVVEVTGHYLDFYRSHESVEDYIFEIV